MSDTTLKLHGYWRSSSTYRVRIALELKALAYEYIPVNLLDKEHRSDAYLSRNPNGLVPMLETPHGDLSESIAMIDFLESLKPNPTLYPASPWQRAIALECVEVINARIQPLQNLGVLKAIEGLGGDKRQWAVDVMTRGLDAIETRVSAQPKTEFAFGAEPGIFEATLIPQLYNARRFELDIANWPRLNSVDSACNALVAFQRAHPNQQSDAK